VESAADQQLGKFAAAADDVPELDGAELLADGLDEVELLGELGVALPVVLPGLLPAVLPDIEPLLPEPELAVFSLTWPLASLQWVAAEMLPDAPALVPLEVPDWAATPRTPAATNALASNAVFSAFIESSLGFAPQRNAKAGAGESFPAFSGSRSNVRKRTMVSPPFLLPAQAPSLRQETNRQDS